MTKNKTIKKSSGRKTIIPLDRERVKAHGELWGRALDSYDSATTHDIISYTFETTDFAYDFGFNKIKAHELREALKLDAQKDFTVGRRLAHLWYTLMIIADEQGEGTSGSFTVGDIVKEWGREKSGKLHAHIKQSFMTLASLRFKQTNNKKGKARREWGYNFIDSWAIESDNKFSFKLNDAALGITSIYLKSKNLTPEILKRGYLPLPFANLTEKDLDPKYENFAERLSLLKPGKIEVKFKTILKDWIKTTDDVMKHRKKSYDLVMKYCQQAKKRGEIKDFQQTVLGTKNWREDWKIIFTK